MPTVTKRILLADDDRFLRRAAEVALRRAGYAVVPAADGEEAVALAREALPDLVLLDLIMPKRQGFEVLRELRGDPATAGIPVVVLSNLGQEQDVKRAMDGGADAYFVKANLPLEALVRQVQQLLTEEPA